jgi:hypothetical protein
LDQLLSIHPIGLYPEIVSKITHGQLASQSLWFANLNTPDDIAHAEAHLDALDT